MKLHPGDIFKELKTFPFFNSFQDPLLMQIATITEAKEYGSHFELLCAGQKNDSLFFLRSGAIEVVVQGEVVTRLQNAGEVLGEMSVLSGRPVSATIRTTSPSTFFVINPDLLAHVQPKDREKFLFLMYQIYVVIVADRLTKTNEKAKMFESSNRKLEKAQQELETVNRNLERLIDERTLELKKKADELQVSYYSLEEKNAALMAGFKKVADLSEIKDQALDKIRKLSTGHLEPLIQQITWIEKTIEGDDKSTLAEIKKNILEFQLDLKPLEELYRLEKGVQSKRVLFADPDKKQQLVARMVLGGTGVQLDLISDLFEAERLLLQNKYDLILCDASLSEVISKAKSWNFAGEIVFMTSTEIQNYLEKLKNLSFLGHVVSRDLEDRTFTVKSILTTVTKILNEDFFGLEKYLSWGVEVNEQKIYKSSDRSITIEKMKEKFKKLGVRETLLDRCQTVSEEMLMNAIYDAPTDNHGQTLFNHLSRTVEINLSEDQACEVKYACDGNLLGVSVSDPFGGLTKETIIQYLDSCYKGFSGHSNPQEKGGAGRGLHQIIESSDLTIFNVKKNIKTEVICLFNIDSHLQKNFRKPSFHYFFK